MPPSIIDHPTALARRRVHLFWDNSNIFVPARFAAAKMGESAVQNDVRIQFEALYELARGGRSVERGYCVTSARGHQPQLLDRLRATGVEVETFERGAISNREQAVDQALQVRMLRTLCDVQEPGVAVLLTGDGAGYDDGVGFHADLQRLHDRGWGVEVLAWEGACAKSLRTWADAAGVFIPLERHYRQITFVQGGRKSEQLSMKGRRWASPMGLSLVP